jgi:Uncharacterized conserved domain (SAYSvFN)
MPDAALPPGFKRSRALWDQTAVIPANDDGTTVGGGRFGRHWRSWVRAILYEVQPVRSSELRRYGDGARHGGAVAWQGAAVLVTQALPTLLATLLRALASMRPRHCAIVAALMAYYWMVRYVHETMEAGPIVLMVTALALIFTVGLSDNTATDGLSAYSVFNKGFQKILGSIDDEALLQQHVGGGIGGMVGIWGNNNRRRHGRAEDDDNAAPPPLRPRNHQRVIRPAEPAHRAEEPMDEQQEQQPDEEPARARNNNNRVGKKGRRKTNVEQRREMQRQRDAAIAMGFGNEQNEAMAMNRLIEDQIAALGHDE